MLSKNVHIKIYRTIFLPVVSREENGSMLGQGCRLWVFENVVLRKMYRPKRDEVTVEWRQLQNKELHETYSSSNTIQNTRAACGTHWGEYKCICRVINKSLQDFRPLRYGSRGGHAEGERVNRGRDTPIFCPTLQLLDISTLGDAADVNPVIKFLPHACNAEVGNPGGTYELPCMYTITTVLSSRERY